MNFEDLIAKVKTCGKQKLAVAAAEDLSLIHIFISASSNWVFWNCAMERPNCLRSLT